MTQPNPTPSQAEKSEAQHKRFLETARALGCDEDEAAFDEKLKAVVGPKETKRSIKTNVDTSEP